MYGISPRSALIKRDGNYLDADIDHRKDLKTCTTYDDIETASDNSIKVKAYFVPNEGTLIDENLYNPRDDDEANVCLRHQEWKLTLGKAFASDVLDIYFNNEDAVPAGNKLTVELSNYRNPPSSWALTDGWVAAVRKGFGVGEEE